MLVRLILVNLIMTVSFSVNALERIHSKFEIMQDAEKIVIGKTYITKKSRTWSKGTSNTYLKLSCFKNKFGAVEKRYSNVDYFYGARITHQLIDGEVKLKVVYSSITPRLKEIRALKRNQCEELAPDVKIIEESYSFPAEHGVNKSLTFGENKRFNVELEVIVKQ